MVCRVATSTYTGVREESQNPYPEMRRVRHPKKNTPEKPTGLVDFEGVAYVEGEFAVDAQNFYGAVDGVDVDDADGARSGFDGVQKFFIVGDDFYDGVRFVEFRNCRFDFDGFDAEKFLNRDAHFGCFRVLHHNHKRFSVGPGLRVAFTKFGKIGEWYILKLTTGSGDDCPIADSCQGW